MDTTVKYYRVYNTNVKYYRVYNTKKRHMDIIASNEDDASQFAYMYGLVRAKANARVFPVRPELAINDPDRLRLTLHAMAQGLTGRCTYNSYSKYLHVGYRQVSFKDLPPAITIET